MQFQNKTVLSIILTLPILLFGFQNCGQAPTMDEPSAEPLSPTEKVVSPANNFDQLKYYDFSGGNSGSTPAKSLDLNKGILQQADSSSNVARSCDLPDDVLQEFRDLLTNVDICEPGPLPDNIAVCMAIGLEDIELMNPQGVNEKLRPVVCHNGRFLCNNKDQQLRDLLADIACE